MVWRRSGEILQEVTLDQKLKSLISTYVLYLSGSGEFRHVSNCLFACTMQSVTPNWQAHFKTNDRLETVNNSSPGESLKPIVLYRLFNKWVI